MRIENLQQSLSKYLRILLCSFEHCEPALLSPVNLAKTILIAILIAANLASSWLVPLIYVDFELREEYIAKVLCVERDKSITLCKGSCYLTSQLGKATEQQEKNEQANPVEIVFFFHRSLIDATLKMMDGAENKGFAEYTDQKQSNPHLIGVFHPPRS